MKEDLYNKIDEYFKTDMVLIKNLNYLYKVSLTYKIISTLGLIITFLGFLMIYVLKFDIKIKSIIFIIGITIVIIGIFSLFFLILIYFLSDKAKRRENLIIKRQFDNKKMFKIYNYFASVYLKDINISNFNFFYNNNKETRKGIENTITFIYKNNEITFYIEKPVKLPKVDFLMSIDIENTIVLFLLILFIKSRYNCVSTMYITTNKYDSSFNDIKVEKVKLNRRSFKSESIVFNKNYRINVDANDIKGPLFLSPKLIDKILSSNHKDFLEIGFNEKVYYKRMSVLKNNIIEQIGILNYSTINSYKKFKKQLFIKIVSDFDSIKKSLDLIIATI
ncbi:hypothetical protein [Spiroplasma turonicum]|uniref:DUF3137 domain-containing protein n=1 Tax=Spiroplasma turonicum TaxID=216946 RepID=A0A0K1P6N0_9MOLU|nr:hypothetical protein [Spiroplasma turonicum]AKU79963.1 hypothetical protein STURON_00717 [Spiroplasma turonicum]ALX70976.1 hypothetical protein STURO_v1c07170 [Spiroplasma turonicum]